MHKTSGEVIRKKPRALTKSMSAQVVIETVRPMCVELYRDVKELGRFMLRVSGVTIAAGLITKVIFDQCGSTNLYNSNIELQSQFL